MPYYVVCPDEEDLCVEVFKTLKKAEARAEENARLEENIPVYIFHGKIKKVYEEAIEESDEEDSESEGEAVETDGDDEEEGDEVNELVGGVIGVQINKESSVSNVFDTSHLVRTRPQQG